MTKDEILQLTKDIQGQLIKDDSIYSKLNKQIEDMMQRANITEEQFAQVIIQMHAQSLQLLSIPYEIALKINSELRTEKTQEIEDRAREENLLTLKQKTLKAIKEVDTEIERKNFITRQIKGYDDNLQIKVTEFSGSLANFAVSASNVNAEARVTDFKNEVIVLKGRIT